MKKENLLRKRVLFFLLDAIFNLLLPVVEMLFSRNLIKKIKMKKGLLPFLFILFFIISCDKKDVTLFQLISSDLSGIHFANTITENDSINVLEIEYVYNGGGVGIGDFNNDGLQDIYFTGNMVANRLYINEGDFKFKDVTEQAGVAGEDRWCSGVAVVDINKDGWLDMYVSATLRGDSLSRTNLLYINQGTNSEGIPTFIESANAYNLANGGHSTQGAFFDFDLDGDLDLYLMDHEKPTTTYRHKITDGTALNNDHLYRNNGDGAFTDISREAGILLEGFGLGVAITDINLDGWPDVYVANDYVSNDLLWINNQDGTFSNRVADYFKHQSYSAMGNDVMDINNDGLVDIITLEMLPEDNKRKKMMKRANSYTTYINNEKYHYEYQYIRNTLQLNNGFGPDGHPVFSEIGQLSGVYQTDWSWTPLLADFDNDGFRDLIITNGFPKDVTDQDFAAYRSGPAGAVAGNMYLQNLIPEIKIPNYAFKNKGDLTFSDATKEWGLEIPSYSNGAAYADLDNDGDLDLVINNINDKAFVYKNQLYGAAREEGKINNFLRVKLKGGKENRPIDGAKIIIHYGGDKKSFYEQSVYRGYLSSVEDIAHFGLGATAVVDSLRVIWPGGKQQQMTNLEVNQVLEINYDEARLNPGFDINSEMYYTKAVPLFEEASERYSIRHMHLETDKVDFNLQVTLPHKFTQNGPGIAVADVNSDGLEDFFVGGSAGNRGTLYIQNREGKFEQSSDFPGTDDKQEDLGVLFFDADNDGDQDLYIVSGSYEFKPGLPELKDRLFLNNGKGQFELSTSAIPEIATNGSVVIAADYDKDGDLDLFVGGNVMPGKYPLPDRSFILNNENGRFTDVTDEIAPGLKDVGIINDAKWTDYDNDGNMDLILAGEWMPLTFFKFSDGKFTNVTASTGLADHVGWWNSLASGDFDQDGDIDYVAGNLGLNTNFTGTTDHPMTVYAKDFDGNGSIDPIITTYLKASDGTLKEFPMHAKDDLTFLIPRMKKKFPQYAGYSEATIHQVLTPEEISSAKVMRATHLASSYIENQGDGTFKISPLPLKAQFAPLFGMLVEDIDQDGFLDVVAVGNSYSTEVSTGRYDALTGLYLKGDGKGAFELRGVDTGFFVDGDAKGIAKINANGKQLWLVTQNNDSLRVFETLDQHPRVEKAIVFKAEPMDAFAEIIMSDGRSFKHEFLYGAGYLSQSTRVLRVSGAVESLFVTDFAGTKRKVDFSDQILASKE